MRSLYTGSGLAHGSRESARKLRARLGETSLCSIEVDPTAELENNLETSQDVLFLGL